MSERSSATSTAYRQGGWELGELLPDPGEQQIVAHLDGVEEAVRELERGRPELAADMAPQRWWELLATYQEIVERMYVLGAYASLWFASDTQSEEALALKNRVEQGLTALRNRTLFLSLWWKALDDEEAERLRPRDGDGDLDHYLADLRRLRSFALSERSEQIINLKDADGMSALLTVHSLLTNRLTFEMKVDGEVQRLTRDEITAYVFSPDAEIREAAYRELLEVYAREANVLGQIYVHRVRDWSNENRDLRGYASAIAVRNVSNDVSDSAVDVLLETVQDNVGLFQRYFRLKASWLGLDKLRRYDIYAPLAVSDRQVPYEEGVERVLGTFREFHPGFAERAERVFTDGHIDSEIRQGKKGGAFCLTVLPSQTPWVLCNYTGRVRDVATLAHELGHAVHSMLAEKHSILTQHPSLPLAETASVFAEMLLTDRLLSAESDPLVRRELLAAAIDDIYATVMRQTFFVRFEREAHEAIIAGKTSADLNRIYMRTLEDQFGDAVELSAEFEHEWVTIPHLFQTPFYCYAYSFGQLLVLALYRRYQEQGEAFIPGYLKLLAHGGSQRPADILADAGVDIEDAAFWSGGFAVVSEMVDELEAL